MSDDNKNNMFEKPSGIHEVPEYVGVQAEYIREKGWKDKSFFVITKQFARNKLALTGFAIAFILLLLAIFAPRISPYSYSKVDPLIARQGPSAEHIFGTDQLGRDIFSRILYGGRYSLGIGFGATIISAMAGMFFGTLAGYLGGWVETAIMRICDIIQNLPDMLLAICISLMLGGGMIPTMIALSIAGAIGATRLIRAQILSIRDMEFVEAAQAINCTKYQIMFKHVLPNSITPLIINISLGIGQKILGAAGLSFIGLGVSEPIPEWGAMISSGRLFLRFSPHIVLIPGFFIAMVVLAYNLIGDGLRDAMDPKLRS
jgi:peptide/nickel transport system permease protein